MHLWLPVVMATMAEMVEVQQQQEEGAAGRDDTGARGGEKW